MTNIMTGHTHLGKKWEEEQVAGKFTEDKNFTSGKRKS